jgi:acetyl-CoA acetyltransferase
VRFDDAVKVVGVGETPVGRVPGVSVMELHATAAIRALDDAGLGRSEIDAVYTGNSRAEPFMYYTEALCEYMGLTPSTCVTVSTGGATTILALQNAAEDIAAGRVGTALILMADALHSRLGRDTAVAALAGLAHPEYEQPLGPSIPALYALAARRYLHEHSLPDDALVGVPVFERYHASLGSEAQFREPLTAADVLASRMIADPLRLLECAPVSDSGCALLLARGDLNGRGSDDVLLLSTGEAYGAEHVSQIVDLTTTNAGHSAARAFADADLSLSDIDVALIYDAFSIVFCMLLEGVGACAPGEAPAFVASGATRLDGAFPCNPHGGLLSHSHSGRPSALFLCVEAVKQLRGNRGLQQVEGAEVALVHAEGGMMSTHGTALLRRRGLEQRGASA